VGGEQGHDHSEGLEAAMTISARKVKALILFGQEIADHVEQCLRGNTNDMAFALVAALAHIGALSIKPDANYSDSANTIRQLYRELLEEFHVELQRQGKIGGKAILQ
jgi:hypothetical protein